MQKQAVPRPHPHSKSCRSHPLLSKICFLGVSRCPSFESKSSTRKACHRAVGYPGAGSGGGAERGSKGCRREHGRFEWVDWVIFTVPRRARLWRPPGVERFLPVTLVSNCHTAHGEIFLWFFYVCVFGKITRGTYLFVFVHYRVRSCSCGLLFFSLRCGRERRAAAQDRPKIYLLSL